MAANSCTAVVSNCDQSISADHLVELFSRFLPIGEGDGRYPHAIIAINPDSRFPNTAIVYFASEGDCQAGANAVNAMTLPFHGRMLLVTVLP
jgi:hypothetical protein